MTRPGRWADTAPDADLVLAARDGDRRALDLLLRRHHDRILVLCRRLCRDREDAEDATQNALIAIVRGLDRFDQRASFSTWSYRVATNACMDELRRRGRRPVPSGDEFDATPTSADDLHATVVDDPADAAVATEERGLVQRALDELSDEFRWPVVLRDLADLDYAEIAELLEIAPGTVRSRISRGRSKLAALLDEQRHRPEDSGNRSARADVRAQDTP